MSIATDQDLLLRFREAAQIESRLLTLETWIENGRAEHDSPEHSKRWTLASLRLLTLLNRNRRLDAYREVCREYLLAVHELEAQP